MIGKTLGHYQITSQLGKGGMGEVFQAKDQVLGRDVAIKILPEEFARDADRVARFQREAKVLASLNHPNIAAIHGLEQSEGRNFLVLELVEGETLAERVKRGPIPVEESLKLALQIAEALEAAHEKGVIHRDLKPANIKVTPDDKVKVLDFGLAKAYAGDQEVNLSNSPTLSDAATQQGVILGTAAYMSPEQARGKAVDKRADIWALGCVFYEMLTGRQTWSGATVTDIIAAAIAKDPDFKQLPPNLHPRIRELLSRCLQKDPVERFRDVGDVRVEIKQILADLGGLFVHPLAAAEPQTKLRRMLPWVTAILGIVIAGAAIWYLKPKPLSEPKRVVRFEYELPAGQQFSLNLMNAVSLAVSRDGNQFVYSTTEGLYIRSMDGLIARFVAGTDRNSLMPFFSPDGQWIGYFSWSDQKLKKVAISGGAPVVLCETGGLAADGSWCSDNTIVYTDVTKGIVRVPANGGTPEILVKGNIVDIAKGGFPAAPQIFPDGKTLLFTRLASLTGSDAHIVIQSIPSGEPKVLIKGGVNGRYIPTGHIVYTLSNNVFAIPFDLNKLEVAGGPVSVLEGAVSGAVSDSGTLVYVPQPLAAAGAASTTSSAKTLVWVDRQGKEEALGAAPDAYQSLKISRDGAKVALAVGAGQNGDIWVWDIPHKTPTKLTFDKGDDGDPVWTPDGNRIVFYSSRSGSEGLGGTYWKSAAGIGEEELLGSKTDKAVTPSSMSRDGRVLAVNEFAISPLGFDIGLLSMEGKREIKELLHEKHMELEPQISPDGRYIAYQSDESGRGEIYVRSFPNVNEGKWQVSNDGGGSPLWSRDGLELFYRSGDATMAVEVETEPAFKRGNPRVLFTGVYFSTTYQKIALTPWDISPDGKRFLMIKPSASTGAASGAAGPRKINVVLNWFEELKQRVPVK